jgi:hypothetical protein
MHLTAGTGGIGPAQLDRNRAIVDPVHEHGRYRWERVPVGGRVPIGSRGRAVEHVAGGSGPGVTVLLFD